MAGIFVPSSPETLKGVDARNVQVLNSEDVAGEVFSGTFQNYAIGNNKSYILIQFPKGDTSLPLVDYANCTSKEFYEVIDKFCRGEK